jgi:hypothetical protein
MLTYADVCSAVSSDSKVAGGLNRMTVSLKFNTDLEPGVLITVTGLGETLTPDDDAIPVRVMSYARVC